MIPKQAFLQLEELLSAEDTGKEIDPTSFDWSVELAAACAELLATGTLEQRKRLIRMLDRMLFKEAKAVLYGYLPKAQEDDVGDVLRCLCNANIKVPSSEIMRWIDTAGVPAICAAGLSGDTGLVPKLESLLPKSDVGWHAALALALLGHRESTEKIARQIADAKGLACVGFVVALEVMNDPSAVPQLRDYLSTLDASMAWDLNHALWRLTGREPLLPLGLEAGAFGVAVAEAWRDYDPAARQRPRLEHAQLEPAERLARFEVVDGKGQIRIDYDPPHPGSSWPRWDLSLYLGQQKLYAVGSRCGTCETTLKLVGMPADRAALAAASIREVLATTEAPGMALLDALSPLLTAMCTGHYLACTVDLDLGHVTLPERSWLTQRLMHRRSTDGSFCDPAVIQWPGTEHLQVLRPVLEEVPTYGIVLPTTPLGKLDPATVEKYEGELRGGARPAVLLLAWLESKQVGGEFPERFFVGVVLDGHHKLMAYNRQGIPARCLVVARLEDSWGPVEDRSRWLRDSLKGLQHKR